MDNILEVKNLNLDILTEFGYKQILHDVSFSLKKGYLHALVGESGCGKTMSAMSILRLIPTTARITSGQINFDNLDILSLDKKELEKIRGAKIALIPQDSLSSLNPLYTIGNQLCEVIKKHKHLEGKDAEKTAIEALEKVQIPQAKDRLKSYPHEFSGGMRQRAVIAMALACDAQIIIADEPTTALDVTIQAQIMKLLQQIKEEYKTSILLITHDLALVENCADEISVMYSGRVVEECSGKEFFRNPLHPYSKALLNSLPDIKKDKLETISGQPPSIYETVTGCRFNPRCTEKIDCCEINSPELREVIKGHWVSCHCV